MIPNTPPTRWRPGGVFPGRVDQVRDEASGGHASLDLRFFSSSASSAIRSCISSSRSSTFRLRDGVVYQRTGRYNLELVRASRTRLRRAVRFGFLGDVDDAISRPDQRKRQDKAA